MLFLRNTDGKKDAMLTFAFTGFIVVLFKYLVSGVAADIAGHSVNFGTVDASMMAALLTPTLGAYVARRYTDKKFDQKVEESTPGKPAEEE